MNLILRLVKLYKKRRNVKDVVIINMRHKMNPSPKASVLGSGRASLNETVLRLVGMIFVAN